MQLILEDSATGGTEAVVASVGVVADVADVVAVAAATLDDDVVVAAAATPDAAAVAEVLGEAGRRFAFGSH